MVVGTPEGAAKVFRAEGKYPSRGRWEKNMEWISKSVNPPDVESIGFA